MDVTAMLNTASTAAALERNLQMIHERKDSSDEELVDAMPTPSATTGGSTAPSSMAATPLEKTPSRRSSDSRTPNRNRTPWDAGGYSLSLALDDTKKLGPTSPGSRTAFLVGGISPIPKDCLPASVATPTTSSASTATAGAATAAIYPSMATSENRVSIDLTGGSTSPRHKFSDSRSSFSSAYTNASSTNNSVAHSRISSLSTVSENQPLAALITDFSHLETRISEPRMGLGLGHTHHSSSSHQNQLKLQQYAFATSQSSPSREACRPDADFQPESPTPVRSRYDKSIGASPEPSPRSPGRAQSPSDAMLIQRPGQPDEAEEAGYFRNYKRLHIPSAHPGPQSRDLLHPISSPTHRHKRAVSAPDFSSIGSSSFNPRFPTFGPIPEPTPSPSQHSDGVAMDESSSSSPAGAHGTSSPPSGQVFSSDPHHYLTPNSKMTSTPSSSPQNTGHPDMTPVGHHSHASVSSLSDQTPSSTPVVTPSSEALGEFDRQPVCLYRGDCQTGSQLRKAISHIFGRNKLCTRMIPTSVWVHYCRKHYQRTRYRNGGEYPQRQIGLVQLQIERVQSWSDLNSQQKRGHVLKDWSLSVRKREQMRLETKMVSAGKKRPFHEDGMEDEDNVDDDRAEMSGTAVPAWVVEKIGDGYSTPDILIIVDQLKRDIDAGRLQQIPDIEILPNIVADGNTSVLAANSTTKKTYTKRRPGVTPGVGAAKHNRSQSVNTSMLRYDSAPMARRSSQPNNYTAPTATARLFANDYHQLPMEKRQRVDGEGMGTGMPQGQGQGQGHHLHNRHQHHHSMSGISDRYEPPIAPRPVFGGRVQLAHRPAFAGIRESQAEGQAGGYYPEERSYGGGPGIDSAAHDFHARQSSGYGMDCRYSSGSGHELQIPTHGFEAARFDAPREHERHHSTSSNSGPNEPVYGALPAPNPQRFGGPSMAQQLESSSYVLNSAASRRSSAHQRSVSEAGFLHHTLPQTSQYGRPTSSSNHAAPRPSDLPPLSTKFSEEELHPVAYHPPYQQHQTQASLGTNPVAHHAQLAQHAQHGQPGQHAQHGLSHGHSHSMSHAHHHSYSTLQDRSSSQYNQYASSSQLAQAERRDSLSNQPQQPAAFGPSVTSSSSTGSLDKFDNVQLPPLQGVAQTMPSPPQFTVPPLASALDSSGPSSQLRVSESAAAPSHSRHQSLSSSVAYMLGPSVEPGGTHPYTSPSSHATATSPP